MAVPITCIDNFYSDPDKVRDWALTLDYNFPPEGVNYPGKRTKHLYDIDKTFFDQFCDKLFSIFYDFNTEVNWICETTFQKIYPYHEDENSFLNTGWSHVDAASVFAGVIYLNKNSRPNSGTTILTPNDKFESEDALDFSYRNKLYHNEKICLEEYSKKIKEHNEKFDVSVDIKNKYNRLICYDNSTWHKESNFCSNEDFRLTQVFFVTALGANSFPDQRVKLINNL